MNNWTSWIIERRWAIIITTIIIAVLSCLALPGLKVDADFFNYMPNDHPVVQNFQRLTDGYSRDSVMLVVESDQLFSRDGLQAVWDINQEITKLKGITSVTSLANVASIEAKDGGIEIGALLNKEALGRDADFYKSLKERVVNDVHYRGVLVSPDGRYTAMVINLAKDAQPDKVALELRRIAAENHGITKVHFAGTPMMMSAIEEILWGDMALLVPLVVLLLVIVLYLSFKRLLGVWLPLAAVGIATLLVVGIMAYSCVDMTIISAILPIILLSNGSAYGIHVLSAIRQRQAENPRADNNEVILASVRKVALPVSLAALTTLVGFLSFISSPLSLFREFGVETGIGIVFSLVLALVFIPAVASFFPPRKRENKEITTDKPVKKVHWLDKLMGGWAAFVEHHYKAVSVVVALITVAAVPGIFMLHSGMDMMGFFAKDSDLRVADNIMNDHFGGSQPVFVAINAKTIKNPIVLQKISEITKEMRANPNLHQVNSISSIIAELNYHIDQNELIPEGQDAIGNLWLMVDGNESLSQMVGEDAKSAMIVGRSSFLSTAVTKELIADIDAFLQKDNRYVALPINRLSGDKLTKLYGQMAMEIAYQLDLARKYYQPDAPFEASVVKEQIMASLQKRLEPLSEQEREKLVRDYIASDDCDIMIDDEAVKERFVKAAAAVSEADAVVIEETLTDSLTDLAKDDPDGLSMAASSLADMFERGGLDKKSRELLSALEDKGHFRNMPPLMAREVGGELFRINNHLWPVTPEEYRAYMDEDAGSDMVVAFSVEQTGMHLVNAAISDKLTESQISSLVLSLVMVFLALLLQLRSLKNSSLALLPVLFTIIFMFGFEGYLGINIDILTALIASLAVGIGVDYSIHISFAINKAAKAGASYTEQLSQSINGSGQAILINASAVVAGFLVIVASQMPALKLFGGLVALAIALSALGALTIIPAVYLLIKNK